MKVVAATTYQNANLWNIPVSRNSTYVWSLWIYQETGKRAMIRLDHGDDAGIVVHTSFSVPTGVWTHLATTITTGPTSTKLISLEVMNDQVGRLAYWIDGVRLTKVHR